MKNEDNSFSVLAAIILAGVILACVPTANSSVVLNTDTATTFAAAPASPKADVMAVNASRKSGTCSNERRAERKADAKLAHAARPTV